MNNDAAKHVNIANVSTWNSGGGVELDLIELSSGKVLAISDEVIILYDDMEELTCGEADKKRPTIFL